MSRVADVHTKSRLLPALLLLLGACAPLPEAILELPADDAVIELEATPFFPQQRFQCGPAALTTVLVSSGVDTTVEETVGKIYVPGRKGSLQFELLAATRSEGRMPYVIDGKVAAIWQELAAGRPVVVLQNLGVAAIPRWHYGVVIGIDAGRGDMILRSGTDRRRVTALETFLRTWRRSDYWGMVVLRPDEVPADIHRERYYGAIAALEQAGRLAEAKVAWRTAGAAMPADTVPQFGLANVQSALGEFAAAEATYRALLQQDASLTVARNNLALVLAEQGKFAFAAGEIDAALAGNRDAALEAELRDTRATIQSLAAGGD